MTKEWLEKEHPEIVKLFDRLTEEQLDFLDEAQQIYQQSGGPIGFILVFSHQFPSHGHMAPNFLKLIKAKIALNK